MSAGIGALTMLIQLFLVMPFIIYLLATLGPSAYRINRLFVKTVGVLNPFSYQSYTYMVPTAVS